MSKIFVNYKYFGSVSMISSHERPQEFFFSAQLLHVIREEVAGTSSRTVEQSVCNLSKYPTYYMCSRAVEWLEQVQ